MSCLAVRHDSVSYPIKPCVRQVAKSERILQSAGVRKSRWYVWSGVRKRTSACVVGSSTCSRSWQTLEATVEHLARLEQHVDDLVRRPAPIADRSTPVDPLLFIGVGLTVLSLGGVFVAPAIANVVITRVRGAPEATVDTFAMGLLASAGTLLYIWSRRSLPERVEEVANGSVPKQGPTDDPSALAQRLSIVEARLGLVEAALRLDTTEPVADEPPARRARTLGWLAMVTALIAVLGIVSVRARR